MSYFQVYQDLELPVSMSIYTNIVKLIWTGYDDPLPNTPHNPFAQDSQRFLEFYGPYLRHQVTNQRIRFREGEEEMMVVRLEQIAQAAFSIHAGLHWLPSTTNSSSSQSRPQTSLLSGSYQHVPTIGRNSSSASRSTAAKSQAYSMDVHVSTPANPLLDDPRYVYPPALL